MDIDYNLKDVINNGLTAVADGKDMLCKFEAIAKYKLHPMVYDYYYGGANDEITLRENISVFEKIIIIPKNAPLMQKVKNPFHVDISMELFGTQISCPILVAPFAMQKMAHEEGEIATAKACEKAGTIMNVSTIASISLEDVSQNVPGCPKWFQLYVFRNRDITKRFIQRAELAGYQAIVVTVDIPKSGRREKDLYNRFKYPYDLSPQNFGEIFADKNSKSDREQYTSVSEYIATLYDSGLCWNDLLWIRQQTALPILLKGILSPKGTLFLFFINQADAKMVRDYGVFNGLILSNHGGRQLDSCVTSMDVLPEIREIFPDKNFPIIVDGGFRNGSNVMKALCLGANAVMIARPIISGLAAHGQEGVQAVLEIFKKQLQYIMAINGCSALKDVSPEMVSLNTENTQARL